MGAPAARSVLLTLLGEYVLPAAGNVWQETLIGALETLGYKTPAARRALARSVTAGWLRAERHGRRSRVHLTPATAEMLRSGTERIYSFGDPWTWDGRWLLVVLRVPEERREVRHQVRTRLAWAGFGSLGGGLWISPHVERERELHDATRAGSVAELVCLPRRDRRRRRPGEGRRRGVGPRRGLRRPTAPSSRASAACARARRRPSSAPRRELVHEWRRFPFLDPDLPADMLPARWPRKRAHDLFGERHAQWHGAAQEYFGSLAM